MMNKTHTILVHSERQYEKWSYLSEIIIDLLIVSLFFISKSKAIYWIGLPLGHAIMSIGRCYLRPLNDLSSHSRLRLTQFQARYLNEFGSWMGMVCIFFAIALDLFGGSHDDMLIALVLVLSFALPHALLVPVLGYQKIRDYDKFRKIRVFIMFILIVIMLVEPLIVDRFRDVFFSGWTTYTMILWSLWLIQLGVIIPALVTRWKDKKASRKGSSQAIPVWRYGIFAFIILNGLLMVVVNG